MNTKPPESADPKKLREIFFQSWQKHLQGAPLMPMESLIVDVIQAHPEYWPLFENSDHFQSYENEKFALDQNPFFHLSCHLVIREQVIMDKPTGIRALYEKSCAKTQDPIATEHKLIPALTQILTEQFDPQNHEANEALYLDNVRKILSR